MGMGSKYKPYFAWEMVEEFAVNIQPYQFKFLQLANSDVTIFPTSFKQFSRPLHDSEGEKTVILRFQYLRNALSYSFETSQYVSSTFTEHIGFK